VGGEWLHDVVKRRGEEHSDVAEAKTLDWAAAAQASLTTVSEAKAFFDKIGDYQMPLAFDREYGIYAAHSAKMEGATKRLMRYMVSFDGFDAKKLAQTGADLVKYRSRRDTISLNFRGFNTSAVVSKAYADWVANLGPLRDPNYALLPVADMPPVDDTTDYEFFFRQIMVVRYGKELAGNEWYAASKAHFDGCKAELDKFISTKVSEVVERNLNHSHHELLPDVCPLYPWTAVADVVKPVDGLKPTLHLARRYYFDARLPASECRAQRVIFQMVRGHALVLLLPPEMAREATPSLEEWLSSAHHTALASCPVVSLAPGDNLWIPFGTIFLPLLVSWKGDEIELAKPRRIRNQAEYGAYIIHQCFDVALDSKHAVETQLYVLQQHIAGLNWVSGSTRANPGVRKWRAALESAQPAPEATDAPAVAGSVT